MNYGMTTVGIVVVVAPVLLSHLLLGPVAPADLQVFVHSGLEPLEVYEVVLNY